MPCPDKFNDYTEKDVLLDCINLCKGISWRAHERDFPDTEADPEQNQDVQRIYDRERENWWWRTWYRETDGEIDVVAFFQKMKHNSKTYTMCLGFKDDLLDPPEDTEASIQEYRDFLDEISAKGDALGLHNFIESCLEVRHVYLVELVRNRTLRLENDPSQVDQAQPLGLREQLRTAGNHRQAAP